MKPILFLLLLSACSTTRQNLQPSFKLHEGMTKSEVLAIMGEPVKSDFYKKVDEWHYCHSGTSDQFISLYFYNDSLIAKKNYTVTLRDTRGVTGSCEKFIKMGNYTEPDIVVEIRARN